MDFGFLASANSITNKYLNQSTISDNTVLDEETKKKFGEAFENAYDSLISTRAVNETMRQSYEAKNNDSLKEHASRLGYSIDNRVIDMLHVQLSDDMNSRVNTAIKNATQDVINSYHSQS